MKRRSRQPRGLALLLVVAMLGLMSALSYAMLSGATLQNRTGGNQSRLMTADYLAESGLNLAMYYLQYPQYAEGYNSNFGGVGYWPGTGGDVAISSNIPGTVNITVTRDPSDSWSYEIVSVAKAGGDSTTQITKTTGARVYVRNEYVAKHAGLFNNNTQIPSGVSVTGDVWSSKQLGIKLDASVSGKAYCKPSLRLTGVGYTSPGGGWEDVPNASSPSPSSTSELNLYQTYTIDDVVYSASTISNNNMGGVTINPTATNPAGVLYRSGALELQTDTIINGTLVVQGSLTIKGSNIVITPKAGFPALIVTGMIDIYQPRNSLTVNGLCYVGTMLRSNGGAPLLPADVSKLTIDGALLLGSTTATNFSSTNNILATYNVTTILKHNSTKAKSPDLTPVQRHPKGVSIVRWGLP